MNGRPRGLSTCQACIHYTARVQGFITLLLLNVSFSLTGARYIVYMKLRRRVTKRNYSPDVMRIIGRAALHGPMHITQVGGWRNQMDGSLLQLTFLQHISMAR